MTRSGLSLIEVLVASCILAILLFVLSQGYRMISRSEREARLGGSVHQIENDLLHNISLAVASHVKTSAPNCAVDGLKAGLSQTISSNIALTLLAVTPSGSLGPKAQIAVQRCLNNQFFTLSNIAGKPGYYFCLNINPAMGAALVPDSILTMQPLFGEFYFRMENILSGSQVTCSNFGTQAESAAGYLYYTLYWSSSDKIHKEYSGFYSFGKI